MQITKIDDQEEKVILEFEEFNSDDLEYLEEILEPLFQPPLARSEHQVEGNTFVEENWEDEEGARTARLIHNAEHQTATLTLKIEKDYLIKLLTKLKESSKTKLK